MKLCLLHLDDALHAQPDFLRACDASGARHLDAREAGAEVRLWGRQHILHKLRDTVLNAWEESDEPRLCFMGSGDFHHITAFLLEAALRRQKEPVTLIHFDNHPDWVHFNNGTHCGSWVNRALEHPKVAKVITLGVCSHDLRLPEWKGANLSLLSEGTLELYPYAHAPSRVRKHYGNGASFDQTKGALRWKTIGEMGEPEFTAQLLSRIGTKNVYLTIDKDVLAREDAITNWDQGQMRLPYLLSLIKTIGSSHRIIGADVTGDYSIPAYAGSLWTRFSKKAEIFMDQPRCQPCLKEAANVNSAGNHALLDVLGEAMA